MANGADVVAVTIESGVAVVNGGIVDVSHWTRFGAFIVGTVFDGIGTALTGGYVGMPGEQLMDGDFVLEGDTSGMLCGSGGHE